jgi:hypothetical protein
MTRITRFTRTRYYLPAFCAAFAVAIGVAFAVGGHPAEALLNAILFLAIGSAILLGGRSETVRMVRGDQPDERWRSHDLRATAFTGITLILVLLGAWLVSIARGHDGQPYNALCAVAGVSYLAAVVALRVRA